MKATIVSSVALLLTLPEARLLETFVRDATVEYDDEDGLLGGLTDSVLNALREVV